MPPRVTISGTPSPQGSIVLVCWCETPNRFALAIRYVLRLHWGSLVWLAPVCGSWVFVSRSSTGRCKAFPMGRGGSNSVRIGNLMVSRLVLLLHLLKAKGCMWVVEQPASSLLYLHTRFQDWLKHSDVFRIHMDMGAFGHPTQKPTHLYSSHEFIGACVDTLQKCAEQHPHAPLLPPLPPQSSLALLHPSSPLRPSSPPLPPPSLASFSQGGN